MTGDDTNNDTTGEFDIVIDQGDALVHSETETREIDIDGDGVPDGLRTVSTETREIDIDGDGEPDIVETVTLEQTAVDVDDCRDRDGLRR